VLCEGRENTGERHESCKSLPDSLAVM